nr:putative reverse transcriptase domain-containing protein [Tanacetum cinerariifolium]
MDWLILQDAVILCRKKEVHVPLKKRTLVVKGNDCVSRLKVVSCMKVKKYADHGSYLFVAHVIEKELAERHLEDVPVICKLPNVFLKDLPGLPPPRQVEFKLNWFLKPLLWRVNVQFLQQLQPKWSRFVTIVKQQHKVDEVSYHKLFDILKQYQNKVNELRAEKLARNANPLALVANAQADRDPF